jgi:hypothetical protein
MRYGYFLDYLRRHGVPLSQGRPADQVTPENVAFYIAELQDRVASVTMHGSIYKLRRVAELLAPDRDFGWLREIEGDLHFLKQAKSKYPRLVTTPAIVEAGLTLFMEAESRPATSAPPTARLANRAARRRARGAADRVALNRAVEARNGLMVALLAVCPIRLKNYAALELGRSFRRVGNVWWIVLDPGETKTGRADERPVPAFLNPTIESYIAKHRPVLGRGILEPEAGPLWISSQDGSPMPQRSVEATLRRTTLRTLGIEIGPHMFRTAAATTAATRATEAPGLASALHQHVTPRVTEQHYNRATAHEAAKAYRAILDKCARR